MVKSEVQELCKNIYAKHKKALDLIYEYKPDLQMEVHDYLTSLVESNDELIIDEGAKSYVRFGVKSWDVEMLKKGEGSSKRILLFEFYITQNILILSLVIRQGDSTTRQRIYDTAKGKTNLFRSAKRNLSQQYFSIYSKRLLSQNNYEDATIETLRPQIKKKWESFLSDDFRRILEVIDEKFIRIRGSTSRKKRV